MSNQQEFAFLDSPVERNLTTALSALSDVQDMAGSEDDGMVERVDQSKQIIIEVMEDRRKKRVGT